MVYNRWPSLDFRQKPTRGYKRLGYSEVRTARKGWRGKEGKDSEVRTARKGWRGKEGKDSEVRTARK